MGSSNRKKKEKKKDFQKAKLKVGKAKTKPSSFTDTTFKSRAIVVAQQSLTVDGPNPVEQFRHNLSLASNSRSENQRRDALAYLTNQLSSSPPNNPVGTADLLAKLLPVISDSSRAVRSQLLKLFQALPRAEVGPLAEKISLYVRAGMTHLSNETSDDSLTVMEWLLDTAGEEVVSCPGGWMKTLNVFGALLGWSGGGSSSIAVTLSTSSSSATAKPTTKGWTSAPKSTFGAVKGGQSHPRRIAVLAKFLEVGLGRKDPLPLEQEAFWDGLYRLPRQADPFGHLNLVGAPRDEDGEMYTDREDRQRVFAKKWYSAVVRGVEEAKKEGGAVGRSGALLDQALKGMADYHEH